MGVISDLIAEFKKNIAATSGKSDGGSPISCRDETAGGDEGCFYWMNKAAKEAVLRVALVERPEDFGSLRGFEIDGEGKVYAEIPARCYNTWGFKVPRTFAVVFVDVKVDGSCRVEEPGARMIRYLPGFRGVVRWSLRFGQGGSKAIRLESIVA